MKSLFSLVEAAEFLGLTESKMRNEVAYRKTITPAIKGKTRIFTLEQLNDWKANNGRTDVVANGGLLSVQEAANFLGVKVPDLRHLLYKKQVVPGEMVGHSVIFRRIDLQNYLNQKAVEANAPAVKTLAVAVAVPADVKAAALVRIERDKLSMYEVLETLWSDWVNGRRMVFPGDMKEYRRLRKNEVFARVPNELMQAVKEKCEKSDMKLSYVTAHLLDRWSKG